MLFLVFSLYVFGLSLLSLGATALGKVQRLFPFSKATPKSWCLVETQTVHWFMVATLTGHWWHAKSTVVLGGNINGGNTNNTLVLY